MTCIYRYIYIKKKKIELNPKNIFLITGKEIFLCIMRRKPKKKKEKFSVPRFCRKRPVVVSTVSIFRPRFFHLLFCALTPRSSGPKLNGSKSCK